MLARSVAYRVPITVPALIFVPAVTAAMRPAESVVLRLRVLLDLSGRIGSSGRIRSRAWFLLYVSIGNPFSMAHSLH